uniref:Uncharacterized protein n=1 Tax=Timema bartmani TaxID=61472 RepID=A0A7R9EV22_9NEOP|nr:unnamed protein product [Timema bartmani]
MASYYPFALYANGLFLFGWRGGFTVEVWPLPSYASLWMTSDTSCFEYRKRTCEDMTLCPCRKRALIVLLVVRCTIQSGHGRKRALIVLLVVRCTIQSGRGRKRAFDRLAGCALYNTVWSRDNIIQRKIWEFSHSSSASSWPRLKLTRTLKDLLVLSLYRTSKFSSNRHRKLQPFRET